MNLPCFDRAIGILAKERRQLGDGDIGKGAAALEIEMLLRAPLLSSPWILPLKASRANSICNWPRSSSGKSAEAEEIVEGVGQLHSRSASFDPSIRSDPRQFEKELVIHGSWTEIAPMTRCPASASLASKSTSSSRHESIALPDDDARMADRERGGKEQPRRPGPAKVAE